MFNRSTTISTTTKTLTPPTSPNEEDIILIKELLVGKKHPGGYLPDNGVSYLFIEEPTIMAQWNHMSMEEKAQYADWVCKSVASDPIYQKYIGDEDIDIDNLPEQNGVNITSMGNAAYMYMYGKPEKKIFYLRLLKKLEQNHNNMMNVCLLI